MKYRILERFDENIKRYYIVQVYKRIKTFINITDNLKEIYEYKNKWLIKCSQRGNIKRFKTVNDAELYIDYLTQDKNKVIKEIEK